MEIKIIFGGIAFFAVLFLTRFLVALLREAAFKVRRDLPQQAVTGEAKKVRAGKLSKLRIADQNWIPMA